MRRRQLLRGAVVLGTGLGTLAGCGRRPAPIADDDYFPLVAGHHWHYRITTQRGDQSQISSYRVRNLGEVEREFERYHARLNQHGTEYLFRRDRSGVYRLGVRTVLGPAVQPDPRQRYVLRYPLRNGTFWWSDSHAFVIERTQPVHERFSNSHPFEMEYQLVALDAAVSVPAGRFDGCARVEGVGTVSLLADVTGGRYGKAEGEVHTTEWYAPGVGLVKLERVEQFDNALFVDGTMLIELVQSSAVT